MKYTPIFKKDDKKVLIASTKFLADTKEDAIKIGWGAMLFECVMLGLTFHYKDIAEIPEKEKNEEGILKATATALGNIPIYVLD